LIDYFPKNTLVLGEVLRTLGQKGKYLHEWTIPRLVQVCTSR